MGKPVRLEYVEGTAKKFWEVTTDGAALTTRWGRIGTGGQEKTVELGSAAAAAAAAAKQVAAKRKKGYAPAGGAKAANATPSKAGSKPGGPSALLVVRDGDVGALWHDGRDLWFAQVFEGDDGEDILKQGGSLAEAVAGEGGAVERWRFESPVEAKRALTWVSTHAVKKRHKIKGDTRADLVAWTKRIKQELPRPPRLELGAGPITATRDRTHPWLHPRVPSTSFLSKRLMTPVFSLTGPLDRRLGKQVGLYVSQCPQALLEPYVETVMEVVVQTAGKPSEVDAYFETGSGAFWTVHLSQQTYLIDDQTQWAITEHTGNKGTIGWYRTAHFKTLAEAKKAYAEKTTALASHQRLATMPPWYRRILEDIDTHNRVPKQRPKTTKLRFAHGPMLQAIAGDFATPSRQLLDAGTLDIGGAPSFCQEDWDHVPKNPWGKGALIAMVSYGVDGGPIWSETVNDGDAGTFNFYAAAGQPFGAVSFSCH